MQLGQERTELASARALVAGYEPYDAAQATEQARILAFLDTHPDALHRTCLEGHLTASGLILDAAGDHALLTHHRKLGRWLQIGGHADGDGDLAQVALREAGEESGIAGIEVEQRVVDLDVHAIPARGNEPEHLHLDVRFLLRAPEGARPRGNHETRELRWVAPEDTGALDLDDSVLRLYRLAFPS